MEEAVECKNGNMVIYLQNQNDTFWPSKLIELRWNYGIPKDLLSFGE